MSNSGLSLEKRHKKTGLKPGFSETLTKRLLLGGVAGHVLERRFFFILIVDIVISVFFALFGGLGGNRAPFFLAILLRQRSVIGL